MPADLQLREGPKKGFWALRGSRDGCQGMERIYELVWFVQGCPCGQWPLRRARGGLEGGAPGRSGQGRGSGGYSRAATLEEAGGWLVVPEISFSRCYFEPRPRIIRLLKPRFLAVRVSEEVWRASIRGGFSNLGASLESQREVASFPDLRESLGIRRYPLS